MPCAIFFLAFTQRPLSFCLISQFSPQRVLPSQWPVLSTKMTREERKDSINSFNEFRRALLFNLCIIVRVIVGTRSFVSDLASDIYKAIPKSTPGMCFMALSRQRWQPRRAESRWQIAFAPFCCRLCFLRCHAVK